MLPLHIERQSQGMTYDPSTKLTENMGSSLWKVYKKVLFPPKDDGVKG